MMWAVLPVKGLDDAKGRLGAVLSERQRRDLARAMAEDVLEALSAVEVLEGTAVVTRDPWIAALAERYDARAVLEPRRRGQTAAVTTAANLLTSEGAEGILAVPGDVPLVSAAEIAHVLARHAAASAPAMTIVPARDARGTNCVVCSPPDAIGFRFGEDSFRRHLQAAAARGVPARAMRLPGLGLDVDTPNDLVALLDRPGATRAQAYLKASGIAPRWRADDGRSAGRTGA